MQLKGIRKKKTIIEEISIKNYIDDTTEYWAQIEKDNNIYALIVRIDPFPNDPREDDGFLSIIVSEHRRYDFNWFGEEDITEKFKKDYENTETKEEYEELKEEYIGLRPLYMLDHSGITLSTSPFNDRWDSGQVGFVFTTEKYIHNRFGSEFNYKENMDIISNMINEEIEIFDQYIQGNVYEMFLIDIRTGEYLNSWANLLWIDDKTRDDLISDFLFDNGFDKSIVDNIQIYDRWDKIKESDIDYGEIIDESNDKEIVNDGETKGE